MSDIETILRLKEVVTFANGEPMKDVGKVKVRTKTDTTGKLIPKTEEDILKEAPELTRGELLAGILMNTIKGANGEELATLNRLSKSVFNTMKKDKGEMKVSEEKLTNMIKFVESVDITPGMQLTHGDVLIMLYDA